MTKLSMIRALALSVALSVTAVPALAAAAAPKKESKAPKKEEATHICPMCPEVQSKGPASCPKCGMDLVEKKK